MTQAQTSSQSKTAQNGQGTSSAANQQTSNSAFHKTDLGNAKRLVSHNGDILRFIHDWNAFYIWNGRYWARDKTKQVRKLAERTIMRIHSEVAQITDNDKRKKLSKHAYDSENEARINAMISLAKSQNPIATTSDKFDTHPYLLTVNNCIIDLRTSRILPPDKSLLITHALNVDYEPNATCPAWLAFLDRIMGGDLDLIGFLQRAVGYSLTGDVSEQCLFFLHGSGNNGKSTFIEIKRALFSDYFFKIPAESLMVKAFGSGIPNDLAQLPGKRFVVTSETESGRRLAESKVKDLTGGDTITARFMRAEYFSFRPTHKLWMYGNHEPQITGKDKGIWRRIKKIPFNVTIPKDERDKHLFDKLLAELPGILNWAIDGCLAWQKSGLQTPDIVTQATQNYQQRMDIEQLFVDDNLYCLLDPTTTPNPFGGEPLSKYKTLASQLYQVYEDWCKDYGEKPNVRLLQRKLDYIGCIKHRKAAGMFWYGIDLVNP